MASVWPLLRGQDRSQMNVGTRVLCLEVRCQSLNSLDFDILSRMQLVFFDDTHPLDLSAGDEDTYLIHFHHSINPHALTKYRSSESMLLVSSKLDWRGLLGATSSPGATEAVLELDRLRSIIVNTGFLLVLLYVKFIEVSGKKSSKEILSDDVTLK